MKTNTENTEMLDDRWDVNTHPMSVPVPEDPDSDPLFGFRNPTWDSTEYYYCGEFGRDDGPPTWDDEDY